MYFKRAPLLQKKWNRRQLGRGADYSPKDRGCKIVPSQPPACEFKSDARVKMNYNMDSNRGQVTDYSPKGRGGKKRAPSQSLAGEPNSELNDEQGRIMGKKSSGLKEVKRNDMKKQYTSPSNPFNLTKLEQVGIKSLIKRIRNKEIIVTSTDKSSRFAVLTREQYLKSGHEHTKKDSIIGWEKVKYLQSQVNAYMWWLTRIVGYSKDKDQKRMNNNVQGNNMEVPEMVLLIKDHKSWSVESGKPVPSVESQF